MHHIVLLSTPRLKQPLMDMIQMMNSACTNCPTRQKQSLLGPSTCMDHAAIYAFIQQNAHSINDYTCTDITTECIY